MHVSSRYYRSLPGIHRNCIEPEADGRRSPALIHGGLVEIFKVGGALGEVDAPTTAGVGNWRDEEL